MANSFNPLPSLIRASAHDAACRQMREQHRQTWNDDAWTLMCQTQERLIRNLYGKSTDHNNPNMCYIRFQVAEQLERQGEFGLTSKIHEIYARIEAILGAPEAQACA